MNGIGHDSGAVRQPPADELDNGEGNIQEECPTDSIGRGVRVVMSVIVHIDFL
jgi:hypothetical protein